MADAATKAGEAVAKLPDDKVLAEAAAKIAERAKVVLDGDGNRRQIGCRSGSQTARQERPTQAAAAEDSVRQSAPLHCRRAVATLDRRHCSTRQRQLTRREVRDRRGIDAQIATAKAIARLPVAGQDDPAKAAPPGPRSSNAGRSPASRAAQAADARAVRGERDAGHRRAGQRRTPCPQRPLEKSPPDAAEERRRRRQAADAADLVELRLIDQLDGNVMASS